MKRFFCLALFTLILLPSIALAKPSADAVQSVLDHYNNGTELVLVDYKFCSDIAREGENKNECVDTLDPMTFAKGDKVYLWMNFMVPKNAAAKVLVQFSKSGRTMKARDINLTGSLRYRTWALIQTTKAGDWKIAIDQEVGDDFTAISALDYKVSEKAE